MTRMPLYKRFVYLVVLAVVFLWLYYLIMNDGSYTRTSIRGQEPSFVPYQYSSPQQKPPIKWTLQEKYEHLDFILEEISTKLENLQTHLFFIKRGIDYGANITNGKRKKISAQNEENFFEHVKMYNNSKLINVRANYNKLRGIVNERYFRHGGNNCLETKRNAIRKIDPMARIERPCNASLDSLLHDVGLHPNLLSFGMPGDQVHTSEEGYLLTYLHIFKNAVVSPDGDVYFQDVRVVPWRCKEEPELTWSQLQKRQVYDEVSIKILAYN